LWIEPFIPEGQQRLLFFLIEGVMRRPVSLRTREVTSMVGLSLILLLMIFVFKNDIEKFFFRP